MMHNILLLYFVDILLAWQRIFIAKFNDIPSFKEKMIGRKWDSKRGRFPFLGGRWMFRREMAPRRGSFPPKEGDLTCMKNRYPGFSLTRLDASLTHQNRPGRTVSQSGASPGRVQITPVRSCKIGNQWHGVKFNWLKKPFVRRGN